MSLATAAEYALMLTDPGPPQPAAPGSGLHSARERELVTLVAQGRTNAQIAAQLHISARTVSSHLDRIRDKTGCRRRDDLTRLALSAGLGLARPPELPAPAGRLTPAPAATQKRFAGPARAAPGRRDCHRSIKTSRGYARPVP